MTTTAVHFEGTSHIGMVRDENQDSIRSYVPEDPLTAETHGSLFAIADGMGGYARGGLASSIAIETFFNAFYDRHPNHPLHTLRGAVDQANLAVNQAAFKLNAGQMGTTLTGVNIIGNRLHLAHVGDTRAYLIRDGRARCLTNDHSLVGELVRMRVIGPEKVRTHHQRSILNRSLGLNMFVRPDLSHMTLRSGDVVLLCSDGLWAFVEDDELAEHAARLPDVHELSRRLVELALQRQTDDNVSVIVTRIERVSAHWPVPHRAQTGWQRVVSFLNGLF